MRRLATCLAVCCTVLVVALVVVSLGLAQPAAAADGVTYRPPVEDAPIVDPFRPPPEPWAAGNRGVDYGTEPGAPVRAAASGQVVFAGPVAGSLHVVVLHDDGIRTSYSFLAGIDVRRGQRVEAGQQIGVGADSLPFGARAGGAYVDPPLLLGGTGPGPLVPAGARRPQSEARERGAVERLIRSLPGRAGRAGAAAVGWARDGAVAGARMTRDRAIAKIRSRLAE